MADFPALPLFTDYPKLRTRLIAKGWRTPDTYSECFASLTQQSGIYLLLLVDQETFRRALVAYVGTSTNIARRLQKHPVLKDLESCPHFVMRWFLPSPKETLRAIEARHIKRFNPPWNVVHRPRGVVLNG